MSQETIAQESSKKKAAGVFGRLFERGEHSRSAKTATLDLDDIQGFILRGYRMPMVRHFLLTVGVPAEARKLLGRFVSGDESDAPQITTAEEWQVGFAAGPGDDAAEVSRHKPDYCLNLGITWQGMIALEIKDGKPVFTSKVPFGYTDGLSVTTIRGGPELSRADHQQPCEPWLFVLRDEAENYIVPEPRELGLNGSFAVFKMIMTDVVGFENFLQSNKDKIDPELLAAKMCGRWRNGVPLALSPETDSPPGGIPSEQLNNCEFAGAVRLHPKSKEPLIGTQDPSESIFVIPQANDSPPIKITGFSTFITTKAAAYCFLPSITAVKFMSKL